MRASLRLTNNLMTDRNAEIAVARSAAPESIGRDTEVLVLGRQGYETAVKGKNGFERTRPSRSRNPRGS